MKLKVKKLKAEAVIPSRAHTSDVGFDLTAISKKVIDNGKYGYIEYGTGLSIQPEEGYYVELFPRSSISDTGLILSNSVAAIDPGYIGEIFLRFKYIPGTRMYEVGERVGQLIVKKKEDVDLEIVEELLQTERGEKGFGSSGL